MTNEPSPSTAPTTTTIPNKPRVWLVFVTCLSAEVLIIILGVLVVLAVAVHEHGLSDLSVPAVMDAARSPLGLLGSLLVTMVVFGGVAVAGAVLSRVPWRRRLRLRRVQASVLDLAIASLAAWMIGFMFHALQELRIVPESNALNMLTQFIKRLPTAELVTAVVVIGVLPGLCEELLFRGYVQTRLSERWGARWGVLWAALIFGVMHLDPVQGTFAAVMGVFLGFLAERTGSIVPGMICHAVNNTVATMLAATGFEFHGKIACWTALIAGPLFVAGTMLYLRKRLPPRATS